MSTTQNSEIDHGQHLADESPGDALDFIMQRLRVSTKSLAFYADIERKRLWAMRRSLSVPSHQEAVAITVAINALTNRKYRVDDIFGDVSPGPSAGASSIDGYTWIPFRHAGTRLDYIMDRFNLSSAQIGRAAKVSHTTLSRIRNGQYQPSIPMAKLITHTLTSLSGVDLTASDLFPMNTLRNRTPSARARPA